MQDTKSSSVIHSKKTLESIINEQYHLSNRNFNTSERTKGQEPKNLLKVNYKIKEKQRVPKLRVNPDFKGNPIF